jgi:hypothetical protein
VCKHCGKRLGRRWGKGLVGCLPICLGLFLLVLYLVTGSPIGGLDIPLDVPPIVWLFAVVCVGLLVTLVLHLVWEPLIVQRNTRAGSSLPHAPERWSERRSDPPDSIQPSLDRLSDKPPSEQE